MLTIAVASVGAFRFDGVQVAPPSVVNSGVGGVDGQDPTLERHAAVPLRADSSRGPRVLRPRLADPTIRLADRLRVSRFGPLHYQGPIDPLASQHRGYSTEYVLRTGLAAGSTLGAGSPDSSNMITPVPRPLKGHPTKPWVSHTSLTERVPPASQELQHSRHEAHNERREPPDLADVKIVTEQDGDEEGDRPPSGLAGDCL